MMKPKEDMSVMSVDLGLCRGTAQDDGWCGGLLRRSGAFGPETDAEA